MDNKLQKKQSGSIKEKSQYGLTFGVIAMMLFVAGFPSVVIFFFGIFAYFLWKTFSGSPRQGIQEIFEFYLSANSILRSDERKWYGFEVLEVITQGEKVLQVMHGAPPLVYFALGALYNKIGNHEAAVNHLSYVVENDSADEETYVHPSAQLRSYVKILRKIENQPTGAPQTAAAIRSLERARKNRGLSILEESRENLELENARNNRNAITNDQTRGGLKERMGQDSILKTVNNVNDSRGNSVKRKGIYGNQESSAEDELFANRKPITEVLHDIYDKNIQ